MKIGDLVKAKYIYEIQTTFWLLVDYVEGSENILIMNVRTSDKIWAKKIAFEVVQ
jgi:hypothetical protein